MNTAIRFLISGFGFILIFIPFVIMAKGGDLTGSGTGTYTETDSGVGACTGAAIIMLNSACDIDVEIIPDPPGGPFYYYCYDDTVSLLLTATPSGGTAPYTYAWETGETSQSITVTQTLGMTFYVTVTDAAGCVGYAFFHIKTFVMEQILITQAAGPPLCLGDSVLLYSSIWQTVPPGTTYLWSTGDTTTNIYVYNSGTYSVTATADFIDCTLTASIEVTFNQVPDPAPIIVGPATLCAGQSTTLTVDGGPFEDYIWFPSGTHNPTLDITNPGNYSVYVYNSVGCIGGDEIEILAGGTLPILSGPEFLCSGQSGIVEVTNASEFTNFIWSTGENTPSINISNPGIYTVTVTEAGGCTAIDSFTVDAEIPNINISGSITPESSCTTPNGAVDITITPAGSYTFEWSNGANTEDINNLSSGNYTVTVSDSGGCTASASFVVASDVVIPIPTTNITGTTCSQNNGAVDLSVTPAGTYTYLWSNGVTTEDLTGIPAGTYSVTITASSSGCTATIDAILPDNSITITISGTPTPNSSCTDDNGAIDISVNPTNTYTYLWSNGATTEDLIDIPGGTYSVTVILGSTCSQSATFVVTNNNTPISLTGNTTSNTSCTQPNGSIDITVGPPGTYTFSWSNGETSEDLQLLTGGTYSVTVTGLDGCTATAFFDIINTNSNFTLSGSITPNNSCVSPNGHIDLTISPAGTYTYSWSNGASTEDIQNLTSGTYGVTVSDINNCSAVAVFSITDMLSYPEISAILTPATCGGNNGAIDIDVIPASGNLFSWSNGSTTEDQANLSTGSYIVTVTGTNGCLSVDTFTVGNQNSSFILSAIAMPNNSCLNPNGSIDLSITPPGTYSFLWSNAQTTEDLQNIEAGTYSVTVTDMANCISVDTFLVLNTISAPTISATVTPASCGANNGAIDLTLHPAGNNTFLWSNGEITEDLQNIFPGTYSVIVTDTLGCQALDTFDVQNINNDFSLSAVPVSNTSCLIPNGSIDLTIVPVGSYTFSWSNGATTEDISSLSAGLYVVTVTDNNSCSSMAIFEVLNNTNPVTISSVITPSSCGQNNGAIDVTSTPSNGNIFLWSNGAVTEDLQDLVPGNYSLTVTGSNGCISTDTFNVTDVGSPISLSGILIAYTNCTQPNGAIDLSFSPAGVYSFAWSNGMSTEDQFNLSPGIYSVTVTDGNGCSAESSFLITDQSILPVISGNVTPSSCGGSNGQISLMIVPVGMYSFSWSNGSVDENLQDVMAGNYSVTVTSLDGCTASSVFIVINTNTNFSISGSASGNTSCTIANGSIDVTVTPAGDYNFSWSNGAITEDLQNLEPGIYTLTVTDLSNCSTTGLYIVDDLVVELLVTPAIIPVLCGEANGSIDLTVTPSVGNHYVWSNGQVNEDLEDVLPGTYSVTVTAQNGCTWSSTFTLPISEKVTVNLQVDLNSAQGDSTTITAEVNIDMSAIDTVMWFPEILFHCTLPICMQQTILTPVQSTEIMIMVIDTNGCMGEARLMLDAVTSPVIYLPNAFSPNNDGINDHFTVYGNRDVELILELRIFDRWGNQVFVKNEFPPNEEKYGWDGVFKNRLMNPAVFVYWARVLFTNGSEGLYKGDVTLVR